MKSIKIIFAILIAFGINACNAQNSGYKNISQDEMIKLMTDKNIEIIDVRTPEEVKEVYIKGTHHFINISDQNFQTNIKKLDTEKTYIVYCRSGARSGKAASYMAENGFKNIYNLSGGVMSWNNKSYLIK
jgi:phage shock protein E